MVSRRNMKHYFNVPVVSHHEGLFVDHELTCDHAPLVDIY